MLIIHFSSATQIQPALHWSKVFQGGWFSCNVTSVASNAYLFWLYIPIKFLVWCLVYFQNFRKSSCISSFTVKTLPEPAYTFHDFFVLSIIQFTVTISRLPVLCFPCYPVQLLHHIPTELNIKNIPHRLFHKSRWRLSDPSNCGWCFPRRQCRGKFKVQRA